MWPLASGHFPIASNLSEPQELDSDTLLKKGKPPYKNSKCSLQTFVPPGAAQGDPEGSLSAPGLGSVKPGATPSVRYPY